MLALRRTAAENATWWQRLFAWATRVRLVSDYCHGGIVIDSMLYQVNAARGLHISAYDPAKWDVCLGIPISDRITPERLLAAALKPARERAGFFTPTRKDAP